MSAIRARGSAGFPGKRVRHRPPCRLTRGNRQLCHPVGDRRVTAARLVGQETSGRGSQAVVFEHLKCRDEERLPTSSSLQNWPICAGTATRAEPMLRRTESALPARLHCLAQC